MTRELVRSDAAARTVRRAREGIASAAIEVTIEPLADMPALEAAWRALEADSEGPVFLSWCWIGTWLETLDRPACVVRATRGGATVGLGILVPHRCVEQRVVPVRLLCLNATGDPERDVITIEYNGVLARSGLEAEVTSAVLERLRAGPVPLLGRWDALEIAGLASTSLPLLAGRGFRLRPVAQSQSARVDLDAVRATGRPYPAGLSANTRSQLRRARRLYEARGALRIEAARDLDEALAFFAEAGVLHQARWEARGKPGAFASPYFVDFHRRLLARTVPQGMADMLKVSAGDEPIGYLYNLLYRRTASFYLSGLRYEADNRLKPGLVTHGLAIEHYLERGFATYDFMGGTHRYKTSLGQPGPDILQVRLEGPGMKLRLVELARQTRSRLRAWSTTRAGGVAPPGGETAGD